MRQKGIYKIQSLVKPDRVYIGSAEDIKQRWRNHLCQLKKNTHHCAKLQGHYNKYGKEDLIFVLIKECDKSSLIKTEQEFMDEYNPSFNTCKKAGNASGHFVSQEARDKISRANKNSVVPQERRDRISKGLTGFKRPPMTKEHIEKIVSHTRKITRDVHDYILANIGTISQSEMARTLNLHQSTISRHLSK